jgi:hypothetical protein
MNRQQRFHAVSVLLAALLLPAAFSAGAAAQDAYGTVRLRVESDGALLAGAEERTARYTVLTHDDGFSGSGAQ